MALTMAVMPSACWEASLDLSSMVFAMPRQAAMRLKKYTMLPTWPWYLATVRWSRALTMNLYCPTTALARASTTARWEGRGEQAGAASQAVVWSHAQTIYPIHTWALAVLLLSAAIWDVLNSPCTAHACGATR